MKDIDKYRDEIKGKGFVCKRCNNRFEIEDELIHHRIDQHGEMPLKEHLEFSKDSLTHQIWMKYYNLDKERKNSFKTFNAKRIFNEFINSTEPDDNRVVLGQLEAIHYDSNMKKHKLNINIEVMYIWDKRRQEYRLFTNELKYGDFIELIFESKTPKDKKCARQCYTVKNLDKLKKQWRKEHPDDKNIPDSVKYKGDVIQKRRMM
jgi:hypothetical protein